jgi:hypothetical protein
MLSSTVRRGTFLFIALLVSGLSLSSAGGPLEPPRQRDGLPRLMLWAWERPTDLRSLDPDVGVAFLSQTLIVRNGAVDAVPRRNALRVSPHTPLVAVTRIETRDAGQALTPAMVTTMAAAIAGTTALPRVGGVQIDFDAAESERAFYRALVGAVRQAIGPGVPLSITALASWCAQDRWMAGLPVDEAVPMLFRMGPVNAPYIGLARAPSTAASECRGALGTSLDEPLHVRARGRRLYVFNSSPWTPASMTQARKVLE